MSTLHLESTTDPNEAIERAAGYLAAHPVELNVIWSLLCQRVATGVPGRYWLLEDAGEVVGVAMESPPGHAAAISPMSRACAAVLAGAVHASGHRLSGVVGEAASASHLAGCWAELAKVPAVAADAQRLYVLGRLVLAEGVPGSLRRADLSERDLVITWWTEFQAETGLPAEDVTPGVDQAMSAGRLFVWDDGGARCVARGNHPARWHLSDRSGLHAADLPAKRLCGSVRRGAQPMGERRGASKLHPLCTAREPDLERRLPKARFRRRLGAARLPVRVRSEMRMTPLGATSMEPALTTALTAVRSFTSYGARWPA
jgi:hypothetical protein